MYVCRAILLLAAHALLYGRRIRRRPQVRCRVMTSCNTQGSNLCIILARFPRVAYNTAHVLSRKMVGLWWRGRLPMLTKCTWVLFPSVRPHSTTSRFKILGTGKKRERKIGKKELNHYSVRTCQNDSRFPGCMREIRYRLFDSCLMTCDVVYRKMCNICQPVQHHHPGLMP